jgi:hypothetical protein
MFLSYGLVATQPRAIQSSQRTIVGKWVNSKGGEINFNADGTGYIPPAAGIEAYSFTYYFEDATHLVMKVAGQAMTVKIELVDDKLTWYTADPNVKYEYTRTR